MNTSALNPSRLKALLIAAVSSLLQLFTGHKSAEVVAEYQPIKLAAMEGHYDSLSVADLYILGWVNTEKKETSGIKVPGGLSYLLYQDFETPVQGLDAFPDDDHPDMINAVFQTYHIMVGIGMFLIAITLYSVFLWYRGKLFEKKWLMRLFVPVVLLPQIANQFGWYTAEMGRQPWVVYGHLRTSDALSETVTANHVAFSLVLFTIIYVLLFGLFIYLLNRKIKHGPDDPELHQHSPRHSSMASSVNQD
jgi:cytochrome d ubiquinol oxidase subunit I